VLHALSHVPHRGDENVVAVEEQPIGNATDALLSPPSPLAGVSAEPSLVPAPGAAEFSI
jgi:hypothetical protein